MKPRKCRFCGSTEKVTRIKNRFPACVTCKPAIYAIINTPDTVEKAWPLFQDRAILPQVRRIKIPWQNDIPDVLPAKRYKAEDRESNQWYLIVSEHEEKPVELFMSTAGENDHGLQGHIANLTALTRLISLMLRHVFLGERITIEKILNQLQRSSRKKDDLPDMVFGVLGKYKLP
ncbi:hypothetical protein [Desulfopila sp. IMCC35008]|uniref:TSCPD domain-containing protein n=1 Tax=Desulfopila sp. IMCC35008 TaxID=2653858 RepID=UPI0013CF72C0|nr:hypothetical protein [Desulfopila sp. IMCC35008]